MIAASRTPSLVRLAGMRRSCPGLPYLRIDSNHFYPLNRRRLQSSYQQSTKQKRRGSPPNPPIVEEQSATPPRWPAIASIVVFPVLFAAWGISDYIWGHRRQLEQNEALQRQFQQDFDGDDLGLLLESSSSPTIRWCVVRKTRGFAHGLPAAAHLQVGSVVEVLQEGVGPEGQYTVCRLPPPESAGHDDGGYVGYFPMRWLQPLESYQRMVKEHERNGDC